MNHLGCALSRVAGSSVSPFSPKKIGFDFTFHGGPMVLVDFTLVQYIVKYSTRDTHTTYIIAWVHKRVATF